MQNASHIYSFAEGWTNIDTNDHRTKDYTVHEVKGLIITKASENRYWRNCSNTVPWQEDLCYKDLIS